MVSWNDIEEGLDGTGNAYCVGTCLSSDSKPSKVANGSILLEMDTAKMYMFDATNHTWREWS